MNRLSFIKYLFLISIISCTTNENKIDQLENDLSIIEQVHLFLKQSKNKNLNDSIRFDKINKAHKLGEKIINNPLISKSLLQFVKISYPLKKVDSFLYYYPKALTFSKKINDRLTRAQTHNYTAYFYQKNNNIDSAYYHFYQGSKYFKALNNDFQSGKMLLNMAIIQKNKRDYAGSEEVSKEALEYLLKTDKSKYIASTYNNLGIINNELNKLSVSIKYHQRALIIRKALKKAPILIVESINNIIVAYKNNGDYENAYVYFDSIKPYRKLLKENPIVKARIIDNKAHTKLLSGNLNNVLKEMEQALSIRKKGKYLTGIMVSYLHLSEYYRYINDSRKSFYYAKLAKDLSGEYHNYRDVLRALRILTLNKFKKNNEKFIKEYYFISDSIKKIESSVGDKFARIRLEADQKEKENKHAILKINDQENSIKNRNIIIGLLFGIAILILYMLYLIRKSAKHKQELYKEFNHRTRNNLVEIQKGILKAKRKSKNTINLNELEGTTQSQLLLYSILEKSNHPTHIHLNDYLTKITRSLLLVYKDYKTFSSFEISQVRMSSKKASIIGLIVNEFIINAFKHGYSKEKENKITVICQKKEPNCILKINVSGKEWNPKKQNKQRDGLKLMHSLSKKIPAKMNITNKQGVTSLDLIFKI